MKQKKNLKNRKELSLKGAGPMHLAVDQKRNLSLYTRKGDFEILRVLSIYTFLTVEQAAALMKRNIIATRRRLMQLYRAGFLNRAQENLYAPFVYFLSEKGGIRAAEHGYLPS